MQFKYLCFLSVASAVATTKPACPPFPPTLVEYSSAFQQPKPPLVKPEFKTGFVQHKWNVNLSHVTSGYLYNSPNQKLVRADEAYEGSLANSMFNFANVSKDGLVDNTLTSTYKDFRNPDVWRGYVNSNYPLISEKFLIDADAVFSGLVHRAFIPDLVASWSILYQNTIPVTVYVDSCNAVVGYDYFFPVERTRVTMSFFNTEVGPVKI